MTSELCTDIKGVVSWCFSSDSDLLATYHIAAPANLDDCVERTVSDLAKADPTFKFYQIKDGEKLVGFFGKEFDTYLTTIFIHPDYRTKEKILPLWDLIGTHFGDDMFTAIYKKNTRAFGFYSKNGEVMSESVANGHPVTIFKLRKA